jgi:hypothetical protein
MVNILVLSLFSCDFKEIYSFPEGLQTLLIEGCNSLVRLPSVSLIPNVMLRTNRNLKCPEFPRNPHMETFQFSIDTKPFHLQDISLQSCKNLSLYGRPLKVLILECCFPHPSAFNDFSFCENIPVVVLYRSRNRRDETTEETTSPSFPPNFNGKELFTSDFSLKSWNSPNILFPNIQKLELHLVELERFPDMPELRSLTLVRAYVKTFPPLHSLKELRMETEGAINSLPVCPKLVRVYLTANSKRTDLSNILHAKFVTLNTCVANLKGCGDIPNLTATSLV